MLNITTHVHVIKVYLRKPLHLFLAMIPSFARSTAWKIAISFLIGPHSQIQHSLEHICNCQKIHKTACFFSIFTALLSLMLSNLQTNESDPSIIAYLTIILYPNINSTQHSFLSSLSKYTPLYTFT